MHVERLDIDVELRPADSFIQVEGDIILRNLRDNFTFLLNPCLEIESVEVYYDGSKHPLKPVEQRPPRDLFIPSSCYKIELSEEIQNRNELRFRFKYKGTIFRYSFDTSRIQSDYVELAIYALWYPRVSFRDRPSFSVRLSAPSDWIWIMNAGQVDGRPLTWNADDNRTDLTLHGRPDTNAIHPEDSKLFWGSPRNLELYKPLETEFSKIQNQLISWLGEPDSRSLRIILVPRDFGGGYARHGLIVIQDDTVREVDNDVSIMQYWGHEFSHSWFKRTNVEEYHNWVDEALATYASLLAIEEIYGVEEFNERIEKFRTRLDKQKELPSIKSIERKHPHAQTVYYVYGTLVIHEIREEIGRDMMIDVLRHFAQKCVKQPRIITQDFLDSMNRITGRNWTNHLEERLSEPPRSLS